MLCNGASKRGEDFGEFGDESRKDVSELAHIRVIPLAEKCSSEPLFIVKLFTDGMSQQCLSNSWQPMDPVNIARI